MFFKLVLILFGTPNNASAVSCFQSLRQCQVSSALILLSRQVSTLLILHITVLFMFTMFSVFTVLAAIAFIFDYFVIITFFLFFFFFHRSLSVPGRSSSLNVFRYASCLPTVPTTMYRSNRFPILLGRHFDMHDVKTSFSEFGSLHRFTAFSSKFLVSSCMNSFTFFIIMFNMILMTSFSCLLSKSASFFRFNFRIPIYCLSLRVMRMNYIKFRGLNHFTPVLPHIPQPYIPISSSPSLFLPSLITYNLPSSLDPICPSSPNTVSSSLEL